MYQALGAVFEVIFRTEKRVKNITRSGVLKTKFEELVNMADHGHSSLIYLLN